MSMRMRMRIRINDCGDSEKRDRRHLCKIARTAPPDAHDAQRSAFQRSHRRLHPSPRSAHSTMSTAHISQHTALDFGVFIPAAMHMTTLRITHTRVTLSFPTVPSAPPTESEKCPFNNVNCSHLTAHSFGVESQARARSR